MVLLAEVINVLNKLAPLKLAFPGDPTGFQISGFNKEALEKKLIKTVAVALDPSIEAIQYAVDAKAQILITHHPVFFGSVTSLSEELLQKVRMLTSNYISLYVAHTNWDAAENGSNDTLIDLLGLRKTGIFRVEAADGVELPIGRLCKPPAELMSLKLFLEVISEKLRPQSIAYTGSLDDEVNEVVVCTGAASDIKILRKAVKMGADTYLTGSASHHSFLFAKENSLKLIAAGHLETENPGMKRFSQILQIELPDIKIKFFDSKPPEKYAKLT